MAAKISATPERRMVETRPGNSRKLLLRKAREKTLATSGALVEDSFPPAAAAQRLSVPPPAAAGQPADTNSGSLAGAATALLEPSKSEPQPAVAERPGNERAARRLRPGDISPNPGTIVSAIVRLVIERGELSMAELLDLMSGTTFVHLKARSSEKGWSQGYVAGAIRNGFLTEAVEASPAEACTAPAEER